MWEIWAIDARSATLQELKRALFIFAKLNPGITYVQGLNEIYAPLYYVFSKDPDEQSAAHAEADAFFCFILLLGEFRDHFVKQLVCLRLNGQCLVEG